VSEAKGCGQRSQRKKKKGARGATTSRDREIAMLKSETTEIKAGGDFFTGVHNREHALSASLRLSRVQSRSLSNGLLSPLGRTFPSGFQQWV